MKATKSLLVLMALAFGLCLAGCKTNKGGSSSSSEPSTVEPETPSEPDTPSEPSEPEEPVVQYTAEKTAEDFNAALAAKGYTFSATWDEEYQEYWLGVNFGESTDDSTENLSGAAYALASFLPEYQVKSVEFYDDPTSEEFHNVLGANIACYYISFTSEDELSSATITSYIYNSKLNAQISIVDNAE